MARSEAEVAIGEHARQPDTVLCRFDFATVAGMAADASVIAPLEGQRFIRGLGRAQLQTFGKQGGGDPCGTAAVAELHGGVRHRA